MNEHGIAQLAEIRREELLADATLYRRTRKHRSPTSFRPGSARRPLSAFHTWLAAGQL